MESLCHTTRTTYCWKERVCCFCECKYRYRLKATMRGKGRTREEADANATDIAKDYLQARKDWSACPACGHYQPEMVGRARFLWHFLAALTSALWIIPVFFVYDGAIPRFVAIAGVVVLALLLLVIHAWIITAVPNFRSKANKARAMSMRQLDDVQMVSGSSKAPAEWQTPTPVRASGKFWVLFVLALGSLTLFAVCDLVRVSQSWPVNRAWHPEVLGPGDRAWVFMPEAIESLDGHWIGNTDAALEMLGAPGVLIPIKSNARNEKWGDHISVERSGMKNSRTRLWISIQIPDEIRLEGKKARVHMAMNTAFPVLEFNKNVFSVREKAVKHQEVLELAPAHAGFVFSVVWYASMLVPFLILIGLQIYCIARAYQLMRTPGSATAILCKQAREMEQVDMPPEASKETRFEDDEHPRRWPRGR